MMAPVMKRCLYILKFKGTWDKSGDEQGFVKGLHAHRRIIFLSVPEALSIDASAPCSYVNRCQPTKREIATWGQQHTVSREFSICSLCLLRLDKISAPCSSVSSAIL